MICFILQWHFPFSAANYSTGFSHWLQCCFANRAFFREFGVKIVRWVRSFPLHFPPSCYFDIVHHALYTIWHVDIFTMHYPQMQFFLEKISEYLREGEVFDIIGLNENEITLCTQRPEISFWILSWFNDPWDSYNAA